MKFCSTKLPERAQYTGTTPEFTQNDVPEPMLKRHMAPKGKCGLLKVLKGRLQFVWEDTGDVLDVTPEHPLVIAPERYHWVQLVGDVRFKVEFYTLPGAEVCCCRHDETASRPGEAFCCRKK